MSTGHKIRAHSKYSASGSERWLNCAASIELEEQSPPSKDSVWSLEGTLAHEVLEVVFKMFILMSFKSLRAALAENADPMISNALKMVRYVWGLLKAHGLTTKDLLIEVRVHNGEIHSEMFGTVDVAIIELFGILHVLDYKYGQGHIVDPKENTQMIQYALGLLERYDWNFSGVVLHICQPRGSGTAPKSWAVSIEQMKKYRELWRKGVARTEKPNLKPFPGSWCHWCRARQIDPATGQAVCPAKREALQEKIANQFINNPLTERTGTNGLKKESQNKKSAEEKELDRYYKNRERQKAKSKKGSGEVFC